MLASPVAASLCASLLFGLALVLVQFGLRQSSPAFGAAVSVPSAALMVWMVAARSVDFHSLDWRAAGLFAASGAVLGCVTRLTFASNRLIGPTTTGAVGNLSPVFAIAFAALFLADVPDLVQIAGIGVIFLGIACLSIDRNWKDTRWATGVIALPLAAAALRGIVQPMVKSGLASWNDPIAAAVIGYSASAAVVLAAGVWQRRSTAQKPHLPGFCWLVLAGLCNGAATLAMYRALAKGPVSLVSPLVASFPLVTLLCSAATMREARMTGPVVGGVVATVAGVAVLVAGL